MGNSEQLHPDRSMPERCPAKPPPAGGTGGADHTGPMGSAAFGWRL